MITIKLAAKWLGTDEEFKELSTVDLQKFYVDAGYASTIDLPEPEDFIFVNDDKVVDINESLAAAKSAATKQMDALDTKVWGEETEYDEDSDKIAYFNFNTLHPDWELDYSILKLMSDDELIDTIRNQPEYVADFLKEFLDAL